MVAMHDSGSKNQSNFKQIIQILQPIVIGYFSPHLYIAIFSIWVDATLFRTSRFKQFSPYRRNR